MRGNPFLRIIPISSEASESQIWLAEKSPTGFLVALWLPSAAATSLAIKGGEAAADLHITLALCGDAEEMDELVQARIITAIDETVRYRDKLEGKISGFGRFSNVEEGEKHVFYASPDVPRLAELRQEIVNCLMNKGVDVDSNHGFTPHITLAYLDPEEDNPLSEIEDMSLLFEGVTVMAGTRRIDIPFWKPEPSYSLSETIELPLDAPLGSHPARALYFGSFEKEWIPFLPKPGNYYREGDGDLNLTSNSYEEMVRNFDNYVFKQNLPIRATHTPVDGGAIGWIKPGGMRLADDGSIEVKPEWNELGKGLVEDDRFLYVSAEFCKVWTNPVTQEKIPNVAVGLALVTRPHFKTDVLNPLSEREALAFGEATASIQKSGSTREGNPMPEDQIIVPPVAAAPIVPEVAVPAVAPQAPNPLDPNNALVLSDLTDVVITAKQRISERQMFADLTMRVELAERRATTAEADLAATKKDRRVEKFTAEVIGRSAENGTPWFGDPKANVNHLVSLAETYGDDSTEVRWAVTQKRNEAAAIKNTGIFDPISIGNAEGGASAGAQIARLAEQIKLAEPNLSEDEALTRAYNANPDLYVRSLKK